MSGGGNEDGEGREWGGRRGEDEDECEDGAGGEGAGSQSGVQEEAGGVFEE